MFAESEKLSVGAPADTERRGRAVYFPFHRGKIPRDISADPGAVDAHPLSGILFFQKTNTVARSAAPFVIGRIRRISLQGRLKGLCVARPVGIMRPFRQSGTGVFYRQDAESLFCKLLHQRFVFLFSEIRQKQQRSADSAVFPAGINARNRNSFA